ncbi:hypothetical protein TNCV_557841 [Trichonephila clavipes]|nr:hypothetical protein TNCV_557841 [Trichonephila clavipes]
MECFTNTELVDMHLDWKKDRKEQQKDCITDAPGHQLFTNLHYNLCEYGSLRCKIIMRTGYERLKSQYFTKWVGYPFKRTRPPAYELPPAIVQRCNRCASLAMLETLNIF